MNFFETHDFIFCFLESNVFHIITIFVGKTDHFSLLRDDEHAYTFFWMCNYGTCDVQLTMGKAGIHKINPRISGY